MKIAAPLNFAGLQALNLVFQVLSSAPSSPKQGQVYFDSGTLTAYSYDGSAWQPFDARKQTNIPNSALATNPLARGNHTGNQTASTISDLQTTVTGYSLSSFAAPTSNLPLGGYIITGLGTGSNATDSVNFSQVGTMISAAIAGQKAIKDPAIAVAATAITLSGTQTIDGVSVAAGNRVLVIAQSDQTTNGLYTVASGSWSRTTDAASSGQWEEGTEILVTEGTTYNGAIFRLTTTGTITIGSSNMTFSQVNKVNTYTAGNGLALTGYSFAVNPVSGGGISATASGVSVDTTVARKFTTTIGDGSATSYTVTHNLNNQSPQVAVWEVSTNALVYPDVTANGVNTVVVAFGAAPASNSYRVAVTG